MECSKLHRLEDGHCERLFDNIDSTVYTFGLRLVPQTNTTINSVYPLSDSILSDFLNHITLIRESYFGGFEPFCDSRILFVVDEVLETLHLQNKGSLTVKYIELKLNLLKPTWHSPYNMTERILQFDNTNHTSNGIDYKIIFKDYYGLPFHVYTFQQVGVWDMYIAINAKGEVVHNTSLELGGKADDSHDIFIPVLEDENSWRVIHRKCSEKIDIVDMWFLTDCPKVNLSLPGRQETVTGIRFEDYSYAIPFIEYFQRDEKSIYVCFETYQKLMRSKVVVPVPKSIEITKILSISLVSVSLASLLATLLTYILLPAICNLPGKNMVSLSVNLFLAQSLYLVSSFAGFQQGTYICIATGIALHFFLLATILWMNVCTFHMLRVLTITMTTSNQSSKRFICYHMYAVFLSAGFVMVNIGVSYVKTEGSSLGYGLTTCYISYSDMLQYTFVIPTAVAIVSNLIMFVYVIIALKRLPKVRRNIKHDRNDLIVFTKLSSLTGVTWLFGFLYSWTGMIAFLYIFTVLNSTMGVFLFVSFVTNRRILNLYKQRFESLGSSTKSTYQSKDTEQKYKLESK